MSAVLFSLLIVLSVDLAGASPVDATGSGAGVAVPAEARGEDLHSGPLHSGPLHSGPLHDGRRGTRPEEPADDPADGKKDGGTDERAVRRVLHLRGGAVLRGPSRRDAAGTWSVRTGRSWRTLPAGAVLEAVEERTALASLAAAEEDASLSPADRVDRALALGLLPEACALCDDLLELHPRDLDLRDAAARAGKHLAGLPERGAEGELDQLLRLGAMESLLMREVVVARLLTAADRATLQRTVREGLRARRPGDRTFAAFAAGRLFPHEDPRPLLLHAVYDSSAAVRESAARAIGDVGALEVGGPLVRALDSDHGPLRVRAVEALGASREAAFVEPLMGRLYTLAAPPRSGSGSGWRPPRSHLFVGTQRAYVQDFDVEVAQGSSVADPVVNTLVEGVVLDVGVIGVQEVHVRTELRALREALGRITGRRAGSSNKAWRAWWESEASAPYRSDQGGEEVDAPPSSHGEASGRRESAKAPR